MCLTWASQRLSQGNSDFLPFGSLGDLAHISPYLAQKSLWESFGLFLLKSSQLLLLPFTFKFWLAWLFFYFSTTHSHRYGTHLEKAF